MFLLPSDQIGGTPGGDIPPSGVKTGSKNDPKADPGIISSQNQSTKPTKTHDYGLQSCGKCFCDILELF